MQGYKVRSETAAQLPSFLSSLPSPTHILHFVAAQFSALHLYFIPASIDWSFDRMSSGNDNSAAGANEGQMAALNTSVAQLDINAEAQLNTSVDASGATTSQANESKYDDETVKDILKDVLKIVRKALLAKSDLQEEYDEGCDLKDMFEYADDAVESLAKMARGLRKKIKKMDPELVQEEDAISANRKKGLF